MLVAIYSELTSLTTMALGQAAINLHMQLHGAHHLTPNTGPPSHKRWLGIQPEHRRPCGMRCQCHVGRWHIWCCRCRARRAQPGSCCCAARHRVPIAYAVGSGAPLVSSKQASLRTHSVTNLDSRHANITMMLEGYTCQPEGLKICAQPLLLTLKTAAATLPQATRLIGDYHPFAD